jgi:MIP family channel proteins
MSSTHSLPQKLFAEFAGTLVVVAVAAGTACSEIYFRVVKHAAVRPLGYALAYGLAVAVMVSAVKRISGGHLNPAVTVSVWVTKRMGAFESLAYCVAQMLGAVAGAYLVKTSIPDAAWRTAALQATTPDLMIDLTRWHGMLVEAAATFALVFVYFAAGVGANHGSRGALHKFGGAAIGLTVFIGVLVTRPFTGAAMNPARVFGPALAVHHWQNHGVYWVAPLFGGMLAAAAYDAIFQRGRPVIEPLPPSLHL